MRATREYLKETAERLKRVGVDSPDFEATQLVRAAADKEAVEEMLKRRRGGEPLQYILGEWEFFGLPFKVGEGVLIPRPDTEILVEAALEIIGNKNLSVLDLCSGSGAIAIAIAKNSNCNVTAIEKSEKAFRYLMENVTLNNVNVNCILGDVFENFTGEFDIILSNPPYIASKVIEGLSEEVKREPEMALDGGEDGLMFYRRIMGYWKTKLKEGGTLAVEIGYDQAKSVMKLFEQEGFGKIALKKDYSGNDRAILGTLLR